MSKRRSIMIPCAAIAVVVGCLFQSSLLNADESAKAEKTQEQPDQLWYGVLEAGGQRLRLVIEVRGTGGESKGVLVSLDQGKARILIDRLQIADREFAIDLKKVSAQFRGKLDEKNQSATGEWKQGVLVQELTFVRVEKVPDDRPKEVWEGTLKAGPLTLPLRFRLLEEPDGKTVWVFDSLDEKVFGLNASKSVTEGRLRFEVTLLKAVFEGDLNDGKNEARGFWQQAGGPRLPMTFRKVDPGKATVSQPPRRPQHPKRPFPYNEEDVSFTNSDDDVTLAGTMTLPKGEGTFPGVILISGSGPQDRDETLLGHKPFLVIADYLTRQGIAVLRFDDRGVGKSTGDFSKATSQDFAKDVAAAVSFLIRHKQIDPENIGLIGHSEGGLIAPLVAAESKGVAVIVLLAGPGVNGEQIILNQSARILKASGASQSAIDDNTRLQTIAVRHVKEASPDADGEKLIDSVIEEYLSGFPEDEREKKSPNPLARQALRQFASPWFRFFLTHEPARVLKRVQVPVLALNGEKDLQVDPELNLPPIREALKAGGNADFEIHRLDGLNHLFQEATTGSPSEYQKIEQTFSPQVLKLMHKWLETRLRTR